MSVMDILNTHTDGQLTVLATASRIAYEDMKKDTDTPRSTSTPPVRPTKPFKEMTAAEYEDYCRSTGMPPAQMMR